MKSRQIHFKGILANVNSSILNLNRILDYGFNIDFMHFKDFMELISSLNHMTEDMFFVSELFETVVSDHRRVYYFKNSFIDEGTDARKFVDFYNNKVNGYLINTLRLMRLYKKGNIVMPYYFFHFEIDEKQINFIHPEIKHWAFKEQFILNLSEVMDLNLFIKKNNSFIKNTTSIGNKQIGLTFENFELSYKIRDLNLQFLVLMNALEILFKPSSADTDLSYRLSRNGAVLLGKNKKDSENIYENLKCLYAIRSSLVHTGESRNCKKLKKKRPILTYLEMLEKVTELRNYVRESIKKMSLAMELSNSSKDDILKELNKFGFGENPWQS